MQVTLFTAYMTETQICNKYNLLNHDRKDTAPLVFSGRSPATDQLETFVTANTSNLLIAMNASAARQPYIERMSFQWHLQTSLSVLPTIDKDNHGYLWRANLQPDSALNVTFCLTEYDNVSVNTASEPCPAFNISNTTANINNWLSELPVPSQLSRTISNQYNESFLAYYTSWFQFWYNTERAGGQHWPFAVITPSMSRYGRGMWLWDTAFHVFALINSIGPRALKKAKDQISVLALAGKEIGHIPRVVGANIIEDATQPPGILTWASLIIFNRTKDFGFLELAYSTFAANNAWYYATRASPDAEELCMWEGEDSGWDTSPRWDEGEVEAIDLNAWLYIDQRLLAKMASLIGNTTAERHWNMLAVRTHQAVNKYLWDTSSKGGMYWDRRPNRHVVHDEKAAGYEDKNRNRSLSSDLINDSPQEMEANMYRSEFVNVVTPAPFWSLLAHIATPSQAQHIKGVLMTPENLMTPFRLPCVGRSEKQFDPNNYWRGPVWININWLVSIGLDCYGFHDAASLLRNATLSAVAQDITPREYYNPLNGTGLGAENFMWTGAIYIVSIQEIVGQKSIAEALQSVLQCQQ